MIRVLSKLLDLLFPPKCIFCGKLLKDRETDLCADCSANLPRAEGSVKSIRFCCEAYARFYYEGKVPESVRRYKFAGREAYASAYGRQIALLIMEQNIPFDILSYVPVSRRRLRKRGYDQAQLIAEAVGRELGVSACRCLQKIRDNQAQSSLKEIAARNANVMGVYRIDPKASVLGKRILLLDDVMTSGSTLSECCSVLLSAGAEEVRCVTLAAAKQLYKKQ